MSQKEQGFRPVQTLKNMENIDPTFVSFRLRKSQAFVTATDISCSAFFATEIQEERQSQLCSCFYFVDHKAWPQVALSAPQYIVASYYYHGRRYRNTASIQQTASMYIPTYLPTVVVLGSDLFPGFRSSLPLMGQAPFSPFLPSGGC